MWKCGRATGCGAGWMGIWVAWAGWAVRCWCEGGAIGRSGLFSSLSECWFRSWHSSSLAQERQYSQPNLVPSDGATAESRVTGSGQGRGITPRIRSVTGHANSLRLFVARPSDKRGEICPLCCPRVLEEAVEEHAEFLPDDGLAVPTCRLRCSAFSSRPTRPMRYSSIGGASSSRRICGQ